VSRPCIFTVFNLNEVYLPHVDIELVDSEYICWVVLVVTPGANEFGR